jgi:prephenate dehydrogenase
VKKFEIGIIGGTGGIGKWFADFFMKEGYAVHVSGRKTGMDMKQMADQCRVVIVSVPIGATCKVIEQIGPFMTEESLLMDFTSLKEKPVQVMLRHSISEVMGCHPLFGPDIASIDGQNIVFCPGRIKKWSGWPRDMFEKKGAHTIEMTPEDHDEMMAIIQGLNHFNTIMMELAIRGTGVDRSELKECSTPIFNTKLGIIDKICTADPRLHAEILTLNPYLNSILDLYEKNLTELKSLIKSGDTEGLMKLIKK